MNNARLQQVKYTVGDKTGHMLCRMLISSGVTAFIGTSPDSKELELYLITYDNIVLASDPSKTWSGRGNITPIKFYVDRFVNIDITVVSTDMQHLIGDYC